MVNYIEHGSIFDSECEVLVCPVNCKGVAGAGLALEFKRRWPMWFKCYQADCRNGVLRIGHCTAWGWRDGDRTWIANLPTKDHWRNPTKLDYIDAGLTDLAARIESFNIRSVALPALGCGLGGLKFSALRPLIEDILGSLPNRRFDVYLPKTTPPDDTTPTTTQDAREQGRGGGE